MNRISLQTAAAITGLSKRTLWRHIRAGRLSSLGGEPGERTLVLLEDALSLAQAPINSEHRDLILAADRGDPAAECDLGILLLASQRPEDAICWFERSAKQFYPEAMCWLGRCHLTGWGTARDRDVGLQWLTHAALKGHVIARAWIGFFQSEQGQHLLNTFDDSALSQALDALERQLLLDLLNRSTSAQRNPAQGPESV